MYKVPRDAMIATVTELRRNTAELMAQADAGSIVLVQKDNEPRGVYMSFGQYELLLQRLDRLESLEAAEIALARKAAIDRGEMGTTSLDDMIAEFAPELRRAAGETASA
jgi:PHD/YefM family antitoxin component YafN of YafNO toxin-antitoxin module